MAAYRRIVVETPFPLMGKGRDRGAREPNRTITPTFVLPRQRLCRNREISEDVILNEVKNLDLSIGCKRRDPSASPQDDNTTQSLKGKDSDAVAGRFLHNLATSAALPNFRRSARGHEGVEYFML